MPRKAQTKGKAKRIQLEEGERLSVGVDVHKKEYHVALWSHDRESFVTRWCQPSDNRALIKRLDSIRPHVVNVFYEAGPTGFGLARELRTAGYEVEVVSAAHTKRPAVREAKTDRLDCQELAIQGAKKMLHPIYVPTVEEERDRQLARVREQRLERVKTIKMQIKSLLLFQGIAEPAGLKNWSAKAVERLRGLELDATLRRSLDMLLDDLAWADKALKEATREVKALSASERFKEGTALLTTVPGIAEVTAMGVQTEMLAPERFKRAAEVSKYQGLAPGIRASGERVRQEGLMKTGNPRLKSTLVEAAWRWVRYDAGARTLFCRLLGRLRLKQKAIVAVARRLGIILWRMLTRKEPYRGASAAA